MNFKYIKIAALVLGFIFVYSCNEDDATGDSTMTPSNPSLTVTLSFANNQTLVETDADYGFTVSISEAQIVDVPVYLRQTGGDATEGSDFEIPHVVTIPAGSTSASDAITIHADALVEDTETAIIEIGTGVESNVGSISSQTVTFNIMNLVEGDLAVGLQWDTEGYQFPNGQEFDPTDLADLRLLITDVPYTTILGGSDGGSFETFTIPSGAPDGEYYIVADWYSAMDLGDQGTFPLSLTATFDQVGVINGLTFNFGDALDSGNSCSSVYFILAKVTKVGGTYTIEEVGENSPVTAAPFVGTATVVVDDWADYDPGESIQIEAGANAQQFWIRQYTNPYISNGATAYLIVDIDPLTGEATVMSNEDFQYGCSEGDVTGSGTVNACEGTIELTVSYGLGNCGDYGPYELILQL